MLFYKNKTFGGENKKSSCLLWVVLASLFLCFGTGTSYAANEDKMDISEYDDLHKIVKKKSPVDDVKKERLTDRAFEVLLEEMFPTTATQLQEVREKEKEINRVLYDNAEPETLNEIISVSTVPGKKPQVVQVAPLHVSALNFIDSTGQPWPIESVSIGNGSDYTLTTPTAHASANAFQIIPKREVGTTNISVFLVDYPSVITLVVKNNVNQYHPSPIIQIDREGPQAKPSPVFTLTSGAFDEVLKNVVLGVVPSDFEIMETNDRNVEAWRYESDVFVRTTYRALSPLPRGIHHGPNGYVAYRLADIPVIIFTTPKGLEKKVVIE